MAVQSSPFDAETDRQLGDWADAGDYHALKQWLDGARVAAQQQGNELLENLLAVAAQFCETCYFQQEELATYKQNYEAAVQREKMMQQQLASILQAIKGFDTAVPDAPEAPYIANESLEFPPGNLWRRAKEILKRPSRPALLFEPAARPQTVQTVPHMVEINGLRPSFTIYCFGSFQVYEDDHIIDEWTSRKGKAIFKYLLMHRERPVAKEQLMDLFWPDSKPDAARNNLNVAIYGLRQSLRNGYPDFSHIIFQDDTYFLNPDMQIWLDVDAFETHLQQGDRLWQQDYKEQAVQEYHTAVSFYQGDFLVEDRYEDWIIHYRQQLQNRYLSMLEKLSHYNFSRQEYSACIIYCHKLLEIEPCQEEIHRLLMRAYCRENQNHLAIRQYHQCVANLKEELDVQPDPETAWLYEAVRQGEHI